MSQYNGEDYVLVEESEDFSESTGFVKVERYTGQLEALKTLRDTKSSEGCETRWVRQEGVAELIVRTLDPTSGGGAADDSVFDEWSLSTNFAEIPLWMDENLSRYVITNAISNPACFTVADAEGVLSHYKSQCNRFLRAYYDASGTKVEDLEGPTPVVNFKPKYMTGALITETVELNFITTIYRQLLLEADKSRTARITLSRRRTLKTASAHRYKVDSGQLAWQTANLVAKFGVPAGIETLLPATPGANSTPTGTTWAWALQVQDAATSGGPSRVIERLEWVFAPCRDYTFLFNPA